MLVVETIARIRRAHFVQGKSIKTICRELRVSRKVVRKVLRSDATEFHYARDRQPMPRLGAWRRELDQLLAANEARPGQERLTLIRVFEVLCGLGYEGGYDAVRRYARGWRREQVSAAAAAATLGLVSVGLGVALVPASIRRVRVDGVTYRRLLPGERPAVVLNLALRRGDPSLVVRNFSELVRRAARDERWSGEELE